MLLNSSLNDCPDRLNCFYLMQDKLQSFADGKYDLARTDIENVYFEQRGDSADALEELTITKRMISTGKWGRSAMT
jgi:amphiphysin